jgi:hypothetical protein
VSVGVRPLPRHWRRQKTDHLIFSPTTLIDKAKTSFQMTDARQPGKHHSRCPGDVPVLRQRPAQIKTQTYCGRGHEPGKPSTGSQPTGPCRQPHQGSTNQHHTERPEQRYDRDEEYRDQQHGDLPKQIEQ